jgi:hypothetical protein
MNKIACILVILLPQLSLGQAGFEKVYLFDDTLVRFSNIYATDSCYYVFGQKGNNVDRAKQVFAKLDLNGNVLEYKEHQYENAVHYSGYPYQSKKNRNYRGNFVYFTSVFVFGFERPYFTEISPDGEVAFDSLYTHYWDNDSLNITLSNFEILPDSTYLVAYNYGEYSAAVGGPTNNKVGVLILKIDINGLVLWQKKFVQPGVSFPRFATRNLFLHINPDNSFTIGVREERFGVSIDVTSTIKMQFIHCDANGNELSRQPFQDTPFCWGASGYEKLPNGNSLVTYLDAVLIADPANPNPDRYELRPCISLLSPSKAIIWKKVMSISNNNSIEESNYTLDIVTKKENVFTAMTEGEFLNPTTAVFSFKFYSIRCESGSENWVRTYNYFSTDPTSDPPFYTIYDIDTTHDGGFILAGHAYRNIVVGLGPRNYGYILKTNCLGFLASPQASASIVNIVYDTVTFVNSSIMAGGYSWHFGDGDTLSFGETQDTISHVYTQPGTYTITLIAKGCTSENDTLTFSYTKPVIPDTIVPPVQTFGDGSLLTVFPNPIVSGQDVTIYIGNIDGLHQLIMTDANGKRVAKYDVNSANETYFLPTTSFAKGLYQIALVQDGKVKEVERLILD